MMSMKKISAIFLGISLLIFSGIYSRAAETQMQSIDADQAISVSFSFFQNVGWTATGGAAAADSTNARRSETWEVQADGLMAEVNKQTGKITFAMRKHAARPQRKEDVVAITDKTALQNAERYLAAAGLSLENAKLITSRPVTHSGRPGQMHWEIVYLRSYAGYPFAADFIKVSLDPVDGSLLDFGCYLDSPLPATTELKLTEAEAVSKAREYFAGLGITAGKELGAEGKIVQPDGYWDCWKTNGKPVQSGNSRLAWEIKFDAPWTETIIWVDGENGNALGGDKTRTLPRPGFIAEK
jgi:hypothetical protein